MSSLYDILIKVGVDKGQAEKAMQEFEKTTKRTTDTLGKNLTPGLNQARFAQMNLTRVVQDAPFGFIAIQNNIDPLLQSFVSLKNETGSTAAAFKAFAGSFTGVGGLLTVLNLAVAAYTAYSMANRGASESTKEFEERVNDLTSALQKLVKIKNPFENIAFEVDEKQIDGFIKKYKSLLDIVNLQIGAIKGVDKDALNAMVPGSGEVAEALVGSEIPQILTDMQVKYKTFLDFFTKQKEELENTKEVAQELGMNGLAAVSKNQKLAADYAEDYYKTILRIAKVIDNINKPIQFNNNGLSPDLNNRTVGDKPIVGMPNESEIKKQYWLLQDTAESAALAMRDTFADVLKPMFNTGFELFDKFLGYMSQRFLQFAAQQATDFIFGGLLSFINPGLGAAYTAFSGGSNGAVNNPTPVTIQMDGRKVGTGLIPQYGNIRKDASRLRYV